MYELSRVDAIFYLSMISKSLFRPLFHLRLSTIGRNHSKQGRFTTCLLPLISDEMGSVEMRKRL